MSAKGTAGFTSRAWLLAVVALVIYGVAGYLMFGFNLIDAIYLTVSTLTTEGFATPVPLSDGAKIFTVSLSLFGVSVFVASPGVLATALVDGQLVQRSRRHSMQRRISDLRDHHIICTYGRVGRAAAREFEADGVAFVVIEVRPELEEDLRRDGVLYLIGSPAGECVVSVRRGLAGADVAVDHWGDSAGGSDFGHGELTGVVHPLGLVDQVRGSSSVCALRCGPGRRRSTNSGLRLASSSTGVHSANSLDLRGTGSASCVAPPEHPQKRHKSHCWRIASLRRCAFVSPSRLSAAEGR
jgi:voltage-gated potassium channel